MDVEIVDDKVPTGDRQIGLNRPLNVLDKVFLGSRVAIGRFFNATRGHVKVDDEALGTVTRILEFLTLDFARRHRQLRILAFQSLHATHFVRAEHPFILLSQFWRLAIQGVDIPYFLIKLLIGNLCQPVSNQVRFKIGLFLKASPRAAVRCDLRCLA
jgi:hypothetical protein